jgi:methylmalonyl-CoA mutase
LHPCFCLSLYSPSLSSVSSHRGAGQDTIVGVNKYKLKSTPANEAVEVRVIDNSGVRTTQIARLQAAKSGRDAAVAAACLQRLAQVCFRGSG